ncbi:MAG: gamma-glutamylcyclotransferase [Thermodesulfobacteriota bacterium]
MSDSVDKIFVYGTLLRGEERSCYMRGCRLVSVLELPGKLYDTKRGYPAALFDGGPHSTVSGELYIMDDPEGKIKELDVVEGTGSGLFRRVEIEHSGTHFFCYEPGPLLDDILTDENRIPGGNWRTCSSRAFKNPVDFALGFETLIRDFYKVRVNNDSDGIPFLKGTVPILVTAPHATAHVRMGRMKRQEFYTGALSVLLHSLTGCHALYSDRLSEPDPNYSDESPFKKSISGLAPELGIEFLIDLHGTGSKRPEDIYPGVGLNKEFLNGRHRYLAELERVAEMNNVSLGSTTVFPAARQMTVTRFVATKLGIPSMQLEINQALRQPEENPTEFIKLVKFLSGFIDRLS